MEKIEALENIEKKNHNFSGTVKFQIKSKTTLISEMKRPSMMNNLGHTKCPSESFVGLVNQTINKEK